MRILLNLKTVLSVLNEPSSLEDLSLSRGNENRTKI